jgi:two-component system, OmpR family, sensor kinase
MSLRKRLVLGLLVLAALALLVADVATYTSLRSFLVDRTDSTLQNDHVGVERALEGTVLSAGSCAFARGSVPPQVFIELRTADGQVVCMDDAADFSRQPRNRTIGRPREEPPPLPPPELPASLAVEQQPVGGPAGADYFDAPATSGGKTYRVRASFEPRLDAQLVVARTLDDVESTLSRLLLIEVLVTVGVLVAIALLGLWVVRLGLRPLDAIGETAAAIAGGDLSRRVEHADERTEVGRLGLALNAMLGQIEAAFNARAASERRLRRFVADASHELRTPLAAVRAYAELFRRGADREPEDLARAMTGSSASPSE